MGSVAAVQANISVPGMIGTHSALDTDLLRARDGAWTAGVGYRPGEAYAKWGRFPCETPTYHNRPGLDFPNIAVSRVPAWPSMGAAATGGAAEEGDTVAADTGKKDDDGNGQGGPTKGPAPEVPNTDGQGVEQWYPETSERRSLGSTPAYLQVRTVKNAVYVVPKPRAFAVILSERCAFAEKGGDVLTSASRTHTCTGSLKGSARSVYLSERSCQRASFSTYPTPVRSSPGPYPAKW